MTSRSDPVVRVGAARFLVPALAGMTGSGLLVAGALLSAALGPIIGPLPILAGAAVVGLVVDNPGNEAILAAGLLGPILGGLLVNGGFQSAAAFGVGSLVPGAALLFFGLLGGIIARRRWRLPLLPDHATVVVLGLAAAASWAAWLLVPGVVFGGS